MSEVKNCLSCKFSRLIKNKNGGRLACEALPDLFHPGPFFVVEGEIYAISAMGREKVSNCPAHQPKE